MIIHTVVDIVDDNQFRAYDAKIFVCGSEPRSRFISEKLLSHNDVSKGSTLVLGFDRNTDELYEKNKLWYEEAYGITPYAVSPNDDRVIYEFLYELWERTNGNARILVDYSSMPRAWYSAILNWCRIKTGEYCEIDLFYSIGKYPEHWSRKIVHNIESIPGCESSPGAKWHIVAIFGLGYDGLSPFSVKEWIEPDVIHAFIADPGANQDAADEAIKANKWFLEEVDSLMRLPLHSVESVYRSLGESVSVIQEKSSVVLVPLGPKPHVLASVLVAYRYQGTACLRVVHKHGHPHTIEASGDVVATRVTFIPGYITNSNA